MTLKSKNVRNLNAVIRVRYTWHIRKMMYNVLRITVFIFGEMAERLKAVDSKSTVPLSGTGGSNPSLSAKKQFKPFKRLKLFKPLVYWRDVRAAEGARLEIVCTSKRCTEGSNPSLSAKLSLV